MINRLTLKITSYIEKNSDITNSDDLEKINYSLQTIFNELFKTVMLIILFSILGKLNYFLFSVMIMFSIRVFAGGYHCSTTIRCLLCSALIFLITCFIGPIIPKLHFLVYYSAALLSILIVVLRAPYPNKKRPIRNKKRKRNLKIISTLFVILWICILLSLKDISYLNCGFLTIILQITQIIFLRKELNQ